MNFERIIDSAYSGLSLKKYLWFLVFFWIALPLLSIVPWAIEKGFFGLSIQPAILVIYELIFIAVIFGFVVLTNSFLCQKRVVAPKITLKKFLLTFPLVFVELWYLFVWNLKDKNTRIIQLLLFLGIPLLFFYKLTVPSALIHYSLIIFMFAYALILVHNFVRLFFTIPIYFSRNISIFQAPKESWYLTRGKFDQVLIGLVLAIGVIAIIFFFTSIVLAILANLVLGYFFIGRVSYELALRGAYLFALAPALVCYYSAVTEIFSQLLREKDSSSRIKRLLAHKVLNKKQRTPVKKNSKKKRK